MRYESIIKFIDSFNKSAQDRDVKKNINSINETRGIRIFYFIVKKGGRATNILLLLIICIDSINKLDRR